MAGNFDQRREIFFEGELLSLPLYLDYQASTPLDERVEDAMSAWLGNVAGNPHSSTHSFGHRARQAIEIAQGHIAALINAKPHEIIFTSGATEANNLALLGFARAKEGARHIISVATEHEAVLQPLRHLSEREGVEVTLLPVDGNGLLDIDELINSIRPETILISVMAANNETGVCQDLEAIGQICTERNIAFHSDAAQVISTQEIDINALHLDLLSLSGHKIYGPMGIGALYIREGTELAPLMHGGSQQRSIRPGTLPTALCVGLGEACRIAMENRDAEARRLTLLRRTLTEQLRAELGDAVVFNGEEAPHIPGCLSINLRHADAEDLLHELPELALSTGSACSSLQSEPSHVLRAMGRSASDAAATLRLGIGRPTSLTEVNFAARKLIEGYRKQMSTNELL
ncbi:aminotransferase class V-fold PLP-dependent enzyme [Sneathiella chungangensis]|uniref:Cysteine desulfurase n=1 Tax=Sneathiella chungangensis TaxID=1418234 RepID=A0A845ME35_9PROT|nr:cysteine desulfurase family protein [Sneathiella chungangensis]MZR21945.1 aminotransferase class V-fold PLP-dependent enzyme [Sneathiella chungangensis]